MASKGLSVRERLRAVLAGIFGLGKTALPDNPSQENIAKWDSLGHIQMIIAVEAEFGVRFQTKDIPKLSSLQAFEDQLERGQ